MKLAYNVAALAFLALAGCGGGGGGGGSGGAVANTVVSTLSFPLQSGVANLVKTGSSVNYSISGSCNGTAGVVDVLPVAATFEGRAVQSVLTTARMDFTNCIPLTSVNTPTTYYDANFVPVGSISNNGYGLYLTPPSIPTAVKVGDTGTIGTETLYADSTKAVQVGRDVMSYVVEPDTANSAIVNLVTKSYDATGALTDTGQERYRILADGTMSPVSADILQYSAGSTTHLILTVVAPPATPVSGSWGSPKLVSNDIYGGMYADTQITGDGVGNMLLAAPWMMTPTQAVVAGYQKLIGMNWGAQFALSPVKTTPTSSYLSNYKNVQLRADSAGNAVAAWADFDHSAISSPNFLSHVYVRNYSKTTGWGAPILMQANPAEYATSVNLSVQPDGTAWLVWTERTVKDPTFSIYDKFAFFAAKYTPLAGWGMPEKVTIDYVDWHGGVGSALGVSSDFPTSMWGRITTDNIGNPTVLWTADGLSLYATSKVAGIWGAPALVAPAIPTPGYVNNVSGVDIAVDSSGNAIAVWHQSGAVYSNRYTPATGWAGAATVTPVTPQGIGAHRLAMDSLGNAFLLWVQYDGRASPAFGIWAARFDHLLGWQTPAIISSPPNQFGEDCSSPRIGFDTLGNAVAIWTKYDALINKPVVRASRYDRNTGWGVDKTISNGTGVVNNPQLAVSADGHATAVWSQDDVGNQSNKIWSNDFAP